MWEFCCVLGVGVGGGGVGGRTDDSVGLLEEFVCCFCWEAACGLIWY